MPRCARAVSLTGYYHVFDRGNSKQIIFEDDSDRYRFFIGHLGQVCTP